MNLIASPTSVNLVADRDQDITIEITIPAGSYLPATSWSMSFSCTHPTTGAALFTAKTVGSGIAITTAGSSTVDALITVTIADTDTDTATVLTRYNWKLHRTDAGSEVNLAAGTITFPR